MSADLSKYFEVLRRYDTPTVCNAIEVFDIRPRNEGWMDQRIKSLFPKMPPIVGYATTATFRSGEPAEESDVYSSIAKQVESFVENVPTPRSVVFQDLDDPIRGATFGEVMCSTYQAFGCVGLITSGAARDLDQVERIGFSCFASGVSPSHSYCRVLEVDQSVKVGGVEVHPGDVILNRLGGSHGIYNHTDEELEFFAVAVCMEKGQTDATNHGDDLTDR